MITQKLGEKGRSDFYDVFAMGLCIPELNGTLITLLPEVIWARNYLPRLSESIESLLTSISFISYRTEKL